MPRPTQRRKKKLATKRVHKRLSEFSDDEADALYNDHGIDIADIDPDMRQFFGVWGGALIELDGDGHAIPNVPG